MRLSHNMPDLLEIWAHRGSHGGPSGESGLPLENTIPAFLLAIDEGAAGIELDVLSTLDGVAAVIHDEVLARLTDGADLRDLTHLTWAELSQVSLRGGHRVPELGEVLDAVAGRVMVNIELKSVAAAVSAAEVLATRGHLPVVVSSFLPAALSTLRAKVPTAEIALLTEFSPDGLAPVEALDAMGCIAWHAPARGLTAQAVSDARAALKGGPVRAWTVNSAAEARRLARIGVVAVMTDHPARLAAALAGP
jgi:glycerophosphoryl diester phosphodiesterase